MKYYICEGIPNGEYNAISKARNDVEYIMKQKKIIPFYINTVYGVQTKKILKWKQLIDYYKNYNIWKRKINELKSGDEIFIQYPLINPIIKFEKIMDLLKRKNIVTIMIIHDLDSLRNKDIKRFVIEDTKVLNNASYLIAHNKRMKEYLISLENNAGKIFELGIFDYITKNIIKESIHKKEDPIIIAGNLSKEKAKYLADLKNIKNLKFNLYGKGYKKSEGEENVNYKGAFLPEELLNNLEGGFGLIWDGTSKDECVGVYGEYLKYNNPHKTSMYIAAGIPVIVWEEAAIAEFILENNLGFVVKKLDEINEKILKLTDKQYDQMLNNSKKISEKLRNGYFLNKSIDRVLEKSYKEYKDLIK